MIAIQATAAQAVFAAPGASSNASSSRAATSAIAGPSRIASFNGFRSAAPVAQAQRRVAAKAGRSSMRVMAADESASKASAVNDSTFEEIVLKSTVPVLVDFWAPWCGPCRMIAPLIDELAVEYGDKIKAVKLNTDESPSVATEYGIRSIPTVMIFKNGQKLDTVIGAVPKSTLTSTLDKYID
mmetsp:Transcript_64066/g.202682  ORF Transcript_64066/g.202682 Transcript_64066/m.202682 type:complete len:183 (-) Transcript_64066:69-617(-)|eukprot:CAMPEP_0182912606 /NCGR_PEP_ID=MMETSP0034_2-20130328/37602_1 /TAXON_ID=156128 /ORGANISM="Nephroselmis pyriformis, Strain CCMP717" /LENGTH=182 /DNA_ID=CAMNT_0025049281 /DNA_START=43 /DNA_END=591 /DNA_ORIENTATION=-